MIKKFLFVGGGLFLLGFLLFGSAAFSHVEHGVSWVRDRAQDSVPVEYELERAQDLIEKTEPQIRACKRAIAERQVEIRYLKREIAQLEDRHVDERNRLGAQAAMLSDAKPVYHLSGRNVSRALLERDAEARLARVKTAESMLGSKRQRLEFLEKSLDDAALRLEELKAQRETLMAEVAKIQAKVQEVEALKTMTLDVEVDGSNLSSARQILERLEKKLDTDLQVMENNQPLLPLQHESPYEAEADVGMRISAYLEGHAVLEEDAGELEVIAAPR